MYVSNFLKDLISHDARAHTSGEKLVQEHSGSPRGAVPWEGPRTGQYRLPVHRMVAAILGIGVAIPVILDVIEDANVTGTTETVLGLVPLFVALLLLVALAGPLMRRVR